MNNRYRSLLIQSQNQTFSSCCSGFSTSLWEHPRPHDSLHCPFSNSGFMTWTPLVQVSDGSSDDERWGIDTRMIYSTVVTGGVLCLCHRGSCLPSHRICIHLIRVLAMTHRPNEVPTGRESARRLRYCFILHCKHVHGSSPEKLFDLSRHMIVIREASLWRVTWLCEQTALRKEREFENPFGKTSNNRLVCSDCDVTLTYSFL